MRLYDATANELCKRIGALIPSHPEILAMQSPWDLLKIAEFEYQDLQPSLEQAA